MRLAKLFLFGLTALHAVAQQTQPRYHRDTEAPFAVGLFLSLEPVSLFDEGSAAVQAGLYVEYTRHRFQPGLELRGRVDDSGTRGTVVGPRIAFSWRGLHPYVAGLVGPTHREVYGTVSNASATDVHGITTEVAAGLEFDCNHHVRWRIFDYSKGNFSGIPGSVPEAFTTGIVIHIP